MFNILYKFHHQTILTGYTAISLLHFAISWHILYRSLNRQQSWGAPSQSNSFRIIQKITNTDGEEDDEDQPAVEQMPRQSQQYQQLSAAEQMRKLKLNEGDRELMNKFRQGMSQILIADTINGPLTKFYTLYNNSNLTLIESIKTDFK